MLKDNTIFYRLKNLLTKRDKKVVFSLFLLSLFVSLVEVVGVTAIMPFVSLSSDFSLIESNIYFQTIYTFFSFTQPLYFVMVFGCVLILFYLFRSALNMYYAHRLARFSEGQYFKLANKIYEKNLYMENIHFLKQNSAVLTKTITTETNFLTQVITAALFMISEIFIMLLLCTVLFYMDWKATLILFSVLFVVVVLILRRITKLIKQEGIQREKSQNNLYTLIASSFGNFKLIKLFGVEQKMIEKFSAATEQYVNSNIVFLTFSHIPRLILDALGFSILILLVLILLYTHNGNIYTFLPILTLYVISLYRILPSLNRIVTNYNKIIFYTKSLDQIEMELEIKKEKLDKDNIEFTSKILLSEVTFKYGENNVLENLSILFEKGKKFAFIGESGSGKSTLVDILMGLNTPSSGEVRIDDTLLDIKTKSAWRQKIGYIPQDIYLFDGTVAENVVFGREYDEDKIQFVLKKAKILDFLYEKSGIHTEVGEGGKLLSGGQKQRIAIARALYGNPEVLVLDEATSALDKDTENEIMKEIYSLSNNMTLFLITHNPSLVYGCDEVYRISNGVVLKEDNK